MMVIFFNSKRDPLLYTLTPDLDNKGQYVEDYRKLFASVEILLTFISLLFL